MKMLLFLETLPNCLESVIFRTFQNKLDSEKTRDLSRILDIKSSSYQILGNTLSYVENILVVAQSFLEVSEGCMKSMIFYESMVNVL